MLQTLFDVLFVWGLPLLLLWSTFLAILHARKENGWKGIINFLMTIFFYAKASLGTWIGLIGFCFGIYGIFNGSFFASLGFSAICGVTIYVCFPRFQTDATD